MVEWGVHSRVGLPFRTVRTDSFTEEPAGRAGRGVAGRGDNPEATASPPPRHHHGIFDGIFDGIPYMV